MAQIAHAKTKGWLWVVLVVCVAGWFIGGCASYNVQTQKISQSYELGNIQAAAAQISAEAEKRGEGKDAVVWRLEQGAVLRAAGKLEDSNKAFNKAEELVNKYEEAAKMSVSREALAAVTNLTALPYEGFAYDKIMMNTYKALNYLELGDYEKARVELYRAYERQKDAIHINSKRIEKAQEEGEKQNLHVNMDKVNNDNRFKNQFASVYGNLDQYKSYADYVNPVAVYLDAIFFMTQGTGNSDFERSRNSFERVIGMVGENRYVHEDLETLQKIITGQQIPATTYVFFETGQAPEREQIRIDLPLFLITPGVPYVGAAFPRLKFRDNYVSVLNVSYGGITEPTLLLSDMDHVVAREFKNELPVVITKTLIASAVKAAVTYGASKAASKKSDTAGFATLIAGAIYQAATNQADLRTWTSLPKEVHFCRFPTPADRKIYLEPPYSGYKLPVTINEGNGTVVWVKSVNRGSPLLVSQFKLKDETKGVATLPPPETATPKEVPPQEPIKPEQPPQSQQPEISKPEQAVQPSQPETTGQEQPIQGTQTESPKSEQPAPSSQSESSIPVQSTQRPQQEPAKPDEATQENKPETSTEQSAQPSQPESSKSESTTQESKPEVPKPGESTQSENTQSSNKQELSVDMAKRMERERFLAMLNTLDETKKQQILSLHREIHKDLENRDFNSVVQRCKKSIEIDPEDHFAYGILGCAYAMLNEFDLSIECSAKASQLIPALPDSYIQMVYAYARKGDKDRAFEALQKAVDRGYKDINHLRNDTDLPEDFRKDTRLNNY